MSDPRTIDAARRVVLLARPGGARDRMREALDQAGANVVLEADPTATDEASVLAARPEVALVVLDATTDEALDRFPSLLSDSSVDVLFEEAELAVGRVGWDAARWVRHLGAKLRRTGDVLPPGREPVADESGASKTTDVPADLSKEGAAPHAAPELPGVPATAEAQEPPPLPPLPDWPEVPELPASPNGTDSDEESGDPARSAPAFGTRDGADQAAAANSFAELTLEPWEGSASEDARVDGIDAPTAAPASASLEFRSGDVSRESLSLEGLPMEGPSIEALSIEGLSIEGLERLDTDAPGEIHIEGLERPEQGAPSDILIEGLERPGEVASTGIRIEGLERAGDSPLADISFEGLTLEGWDHEPAAAASADGMGLSLESDDLQDRIASLGLVQEPAPASSTTGAVLILAGIGGPDAVRQLLGALPEGFPQAVLIQQRLDGGHYDKLVMQMQRATRLPVRLAAEGEPVQPGTIYVLPPSVGVGASGQGNVFTADGSDPLATLSPVDSAVLMLSGSDPARVDDALNLAGNGAFVAAQSLDGCYDVAAPAALASRGAESGSPPELARRLAERWSGAGRS